MSDQEEPRYTLAEAAKVIAETTCVTYGHDWRHVTSGMGDLALVICDCCGVSYTTTKNPTKENRQP